MRREEQIDRNSPGRAGLGNAAGGIGVTNPTRQGFFQGYAVDDTPGSVRMQSFRGRNFPKRLPNNRTLGAASGHGGGKNVGTGNSEGEAAVSPHRAACCVCGEKVGMQTGRVAGRTESRFRALARPRRRRLGLDEGKTSRYIMLSVVLTKNFLMTEDVICRPRPPEHEGDGFGLLGSEDSPRNYYFYIVNSNN